MTYEKLDENTVKKIDTVQTETIFNIYQITAERDRLQNKVNDLNSLISEMGNVGVVKP